MCPEALRFERFKLFFHFKILVVTSIKHLQKTQSAKVTSLVMCVS